MLDIGTEAPGLQMDLATGRMLTQKAAAFLGRFRQQVYRPVQADFQKIIAILQAGEASLIFQVGSVASKARLDHVACFRMGTHIAWQGQQFQRRLQIHCRRGHAFGKRGTFRLFRFRIAKLDIGTVGTIAYIDRQSTVRIIAKMPVANNAGLGLGILAVCH